MASSEEAEPTPVVDGAIVLSSLASHALTGVAVPQPVQKNFWKSVGRLCTAAVDVPVSYFEGLAAEKRAETEARVKLIQTGNSQIAEGLEVPPEYIQAAGRKFAAKIVRESQNVDKVVKGAEEELRKDPPHPEQAEAPPISDDWLNHFDREVGPVNGEDMRRLFSRMLAGEIRRPSSFSIRSVKTLGEFGTSVAEKFKLACSLMSCYRVGREIGMGMLIVPGGIGNGNELRPYGLTFGDILLLQEHGLLVAELRTEHDYLACVATDNNTVDASFVYLGQPLGLRRLPEAPSVTELKVTGFALETLTLP